MRRVGGAGRTETARLINELPGELGITRPVLVGATVAGDVGIDGTLTVAGTDVAATLATVLDRLDGLEDHTSTLGSQLTAANSRIDSLEADNTTLTGRVDSLESGLTAANSRIGALESEVDGLQATLDGVTRTSVNGRDTLRFEAMNLQIVNGTGTTSGTPNGEGNLIVGYNTPRDTGTAAADRAGSHYLIVGDEHHWTRHGGIVAGLHNTASGDWASVSGGRVNTASGSRASVTGGVANTASGAYTSVLGGWNGTASDIYDSRVGNTDFPDS